MRIRIVSDLHIDVNSKYPLEFTDKDTFTVVAGDVAGDPMKAVKWLRGNVHNGVAVAGNHIVYNHLNLPVQDIRELLARELPMDETFTYLDCLVNDGRQFTKELDGIVFMGSTLYTDYLLPVNGLKYDAPEGDVIRANMTAGGRFLNDFTWGRTREKGSGIVRRLTPERYLEWHKETMRLFDGKLTEIEKNSPDKQVVVVTHHCPSTGCVASHYRYSNVNSSFVSDLDWFIEKHPSIKLWVCGHVHNRFAFKVGNCLVVANPRGYCPAGEDLDWNMNVTVDSNTWEIVTNK